MMFNIVALLVATVFGASAGQRHDDSFEPNLPFGSCLPVINSHVRTSVVENPAVSFPEFAPPATVSETCHCFNTLVRPQIHNEVISVPSVDRIVRTVSTPIVETIDCGGLTRLTTYGHGGGGAHAEQESGGNCRQNRNVGFIARPTIFAYHPSDGRNSNGGRITAFQIRN